MIKLTFVSWEFCCGYGSDQMSNFEYCQVEIFHVVVVVVVIVVAVVKKWLKKFGRENARAKSGCAAYKYTCIAYPCMQVATI